MCKRSVFLIPLVLLALIGNTSAIVSPSASDFTGDGLVDIADFEIMACNWLGVECDSSGLLSHWKFDEASGFTAADSSENSNTGTLHNGPVWQLTDSKIGGALEFDGNDDFVQTPDSSSKLQLTGDYTLTVWLKANSVQDVWAGIFVKTNPSESDNHWGIQFDDSSDRKLIVFHPDGNWDTGIRLSDLAYHWHHISVIRSGNTMKSYFDGEQVNTATWTAAPGSGDGHLNIATEKANQGFFEGLVGDIRIYDYALSNAEIAYLTKLSADLSDDGEIDFIDFAILANNWLWPSEQTRPSENGLELLSDPFDSSSSDWQEVYLEGTTGGSYSVADGNLAIEVTESNRIYGIYNNNPISGHFYAEVEFEDDNFCGLALIHKKNGEPDTNNFTSICVDKDALGNTVIKVSDRQNGVDDVLDNTGSLPASRYETILDESVYSVPFVGTNKKIRIFRDGPAGFLHFYYAVGKEIKGEWTEGWMELAPSKGWGTLGQNYYVALIARSGNASLAQVVFDNVRVVQKPTKDRNDTMTGFKALRGEYNWSGFFGDAVVITFGDDFDYSNSDRKFVFWSEMNYVPAWHINNQCLYAYEFVETWGGGRGCYEPMSDRLLRWSKVEVIEDNDVRKVVHWHYVLCNPDYAVFNDNNIGTQLPEIDEYWTFYPDGTGIRHVVYTPKLLDGIYNWHELSELIAIAGSLTDPNEHLDSPALSVLNLNGNVETYHIGDDWANTDTSNWDQVIMATHFKDAPDAFNVFSDGSDILETYSHYKLEFDISWHDTDYRMCHWPVGKEPFQGDDKTHGTWKAQVSHTSLIGVEADLMGVGEEGLRSTQWVDYYKIDGRGRKYREWASLVGLNEPNDPNGLRNKTATWLYPGDINVLNPSSSRFERINYNQKEIVFDNIGSKRLCYFTLHPNSVVVNPAFKVKNWGSNPVRVNIDGQWLITGEDFKSAEINDVNSVIIWVKGLFDSTTTFAIQDSNDELPSPNPSDDGLLAYYKFDETSFSIAIDSSGNGNTGVLQNGPNRVPDADILSDGNALNFDGNNDFIQTSDSSSRLQITNDYTLAVWTKANSVQTDWAGIMVKTSPDGSANHWGLQFDNAGGIVVFHPDGNWNTGIKLSDIAADWHHISIVRSGTTMTSYLDSKQVNSNTWTAAPGSGNGHLNIGTERDAVCNFTGSIDELRVYDRALSDTEISNLYRINPMSWWKFDESAGTTAADSSGYNNIGTLYNGPVWQSTGGVFDGALAFDGTNDYVRTADDLNKLQITGDYTLTVWTKANSVQSSWAGIMIKTSPDGSINHWGLQFNDVGGIVVYHPDGSWDTGITLSNIAGDWHLISIVRSGSKMTSYLDNKVVNNATWTAAPGSGDGHLNIGTERSLWGFFEGLIDNIRIYDQALSSTEISNLFRVDLATAWNPKPIDGAELVPLTSNLSWSAGDYAVSHNVYFGTDSTPDETEFQGNQTVTTFDPGVLQSNTTYYWRIDEINDANPNSPWVGNVWSFTTSGEEVVTFFVLADTHYGYQSEDDEAANKATIDNMNALPGITYPDSLGGGDVQTPAGVLVAGDLTQYGSWIQWYGWVALYGINGEGRVDYPVYEGYGNHDCDIYGDEVAKNEIINRNNNRVGLTNISSNGWHYSWDWGVDSTHQVHFINLNLYPGGNTNAENSLAFLEDDLATYVGSSGRPVVIEQHYGFDSFSNDYWTSAERNAYFEALSGYNVIGIFHGHHHSTFFYTWNGYDVYNVSHAPREKFVVVRITQSEMVVLEREGTDTWGIKTWKPISW